MIRMHDCGFGDCFEIKNKGYGALYVDFGIHSSTMDKTSREARYEHIINHMKDDCDFLLTHYHDDHYAGAIYMGNKGKKFRNVYIPDIWKINGSVDVIKLTLLRGLITKSVIKNGLSLIQFLKLICSASGKIYFVKRESMIQNKYIALWPDEGYINRRTQNIVNEIGEEFDINHLGWNRLSEIAEKLNTIVLRLEEIEVSDLRYTLLDELEEVEVEYEQLVNAFEMNEKIQCKLSQYGNEISVVFQNKSINDRHILFAGDVRGKRAWKFMESNRDGQIPMYENYSVIKIPHHGTTPYYHSFRKKCDAKTKLLIPNGQILRPTWDIDKRYSSDANVKRSSVVCADNAACQAVTKKGCNCLKASLVSKRLCHYIDV